MLIADDSPIIRDRLRSLLEDEGYLDILGLAANGSEVLDQLALKGPDVILLDLLMPGLTGLELLPSIRRQCRHCLIIVLTNHSTKEFSDRCYQAGADHFLDKSREFERVPVLIRSRYDHNRNRVQTALMPRNRSGNKIQPPGLGGIR